MLQDNSINAELGLAASEDAILDTLAERAEKEIVSGSSSEKNLIGECAPFLSKLCRNFSLMQKVHAAAFPSFSISFLSFSYIPLDSIVYFPNKEHYAQHYDYFLCHLNL